MNRDRLRQSLWAVLLSVCLCGGSLGCMVSGMSLMDGEQFLPILLWCLFWAVAMSGLCNLRLAPLLFPALAVWLAVRWFFGPLEASTERLLMELSTAYDSAYGCGVVFWTDEPGAGTLAPALRAIALVMTLAVCWVVVRRTTRWGVLPVTLLPLASTLVLTYTVPHTGALAVYLFGFLMLLLSQGVRRRDMIQGNLLCRKIALPIALVLAAVFFLNPKDSYDKQELADKLEQSVARLVERFTGPEELPQDPTLGTIRLPVSGDTSDTINLKNVGPKSRQTQYVMTVESTGSGFLYLRGASFADYDGHTWRSGNQTQYDWEWPQFREEGTEQTLTVSTRSIHSVQYLPYYCQDFSRLSQGRYENSQNLKTYRVTYYTGNPTAASGGAIQVDSQYTQLPQDTQAWAERLALSILGTSRPPQTAEEAAQSAEKIAAFVRASAEYSLQTQRIPEGEEDFVRWFLEESETGYCIHFASSAAVLLRAAGIPSRYVTGYAISVRAGQATQVRLANAHAWVEYYLPGTGWVILEATPSASDTPENPPVEPTDPTQPPLQTTGGEDPGTVTTPSLTDPEPTLPQNTDNPGSATGTAPEPPPREPLDLSWLKYVLITALILACIPAQRWLRLRLRRQRISERRGNKRALAYWREAERLARILGEKPPQELLSLARKAKFSQHTLTREEFVPFRLYLSQCVVRLKQRPWQYQLLYRFVWALY